MRNRIKFKSGDQFFFLPWFIASSLRQSP
jgi:hypothetical protein